MSEDRSAAARRARIEALRAAEKAKARRRRAGLIGAAPPQPGEKWADASRLPPTRTAFLVNWQPTAVVPT